MAAQDPLKSWDPKVGRFHSTWATQSSTEWASKYGVLPKFLDPTQLFNPYGKSALTPHAPDNPRLREERKNLQKWLMSGFWPELLEEIGAYPYQIDYTPALTNPIDELFWIEQWQPYNKGGWPVLNMEFPDHEPFFPIEADNTGLWSADNPAVWRRLTPILRLCTRFLHHSAATSWLDAFYFGERTDVPEALDRRNAWAKLQHGPLKFFHKRDPAVLDSMKTQSKTAVLKEILKNRIQFGIGSGLLQPWDRETPIETDGPWEGYTVIETQRENKNFEFYTDNKAWIDIALELLLPLFRHDISPIERLSHQFYIAITLLHEFAHAINQLQDPPQGRTIVRNEPAYGGDIHGNGAEIFCELGYSFVKGLLGANLRFINPAYIVGAISVGFLLNKEIPLRTYDKGIYLHEAGENIAQFEETNRLVPIVSKYYERIHTDEFWDNMALNFGLSILAPTPASVVVIQPDSARPELSSYVFNESKRAWMFTLEAIESNVKLLSTLDPKQREAFDTALIQKDEEVGKRRGIIYLDSRIDTATRVRECNEALEKHFDQGMGDLSDAKLIQLFRNFADTLQLETDQEAQCSIDFMAGADITTTSSMEFRNRLIETNWQARDMVKKAKEDCTRVGVATLGSNFNSLRRTFDQILVALRVVHVILTEGVKPQSNESYEEVMYRVGAALDPEPLPDDAQYQYTMVDAADHLTIADEGMKAYQAHDYDKCREHGRRMLSQLDMEGYNQGVGMILIAMHPGEVRRRWCSMQGIHVLNVIFQSNPTPFLQQWLKIGIEVYESIQDMSVNRDIRNELCILGID